MIAARALVAKELLAFQIAWRAASELGECVLWIDGGGHRTSRVASCLHGIAAASKAVSPDADFSRRPIEPSRLTEAEWASAIKNVEKIEAVPFFVDDTPMPQVKDIELQMRRVAKRHRRLGVVVVASLQRVGRAVGDMRPEHQQYREVLSALKRLASEMGCAIVVLTTAPQDRQHELQHMPTLNDLPDPVGFARLTEIQLFLHRPSLYSPSAVERDEVLIGASGRVGFESVDRLRFDPVARRFRDAERPEAVD